MDDRPSPLSTLAAAVALLGAAACASVQDAASASVDAATQPSPLAWEKLPGMHTGVFNAAISLSSRGGDGDEAIITGGINGGGHSSHIVQAFHLETRRWRLVAKLPMSRCFHAQVTLADGRVLIIGGQTGRVPGGLAPLADGAIIDPANGAVKRIPELPRAAAEPTAHLLADGRVLVIGGPHASVFDPAEEKWVAHVALHEARTSHASVVMGDGRALVVGGLGRRTLELIDVSAGTSTLLPIELDDPTDDLAVAALPDGRVWLLGGQKASGDTLDRTYIVDLSDESAPSIAPGPPLGVRHGIADHSAGTVGPWVIVAGGESERGGADSELSLARILDTRTLEVWSLPPMSVPHDDAVSLAIGRSFYVFGGYRAENSPLPGVRLPTTVSAVERIEVPAERME